MPIHILRENHPAEEGPGLANCTLIFVLLISLKDHYESAAVVAIVDDHHRNSEQGGAQPVTARDKPHPSPYEPHP